MLHTYIVYIIYIRKYIRFSVCKDYFVLRLFFQFFNICSFLSIQIRSYFRSIIKTLDEWKILDLNIFICRRTKNEKTTEIQKVL